MRLLLLQTIALATHQGWALPQSDGPQRDVVEVLSPDLCAANDGYFPDPFQCDKYYECVDGVPTEKICPDGQAFKDDNPKREVCEYHFNVDCTLRDQFQTAQVSENCPRANGYFAHADETICNEFYYCVGGDAAHNACPEGLHFSKKSGNCAWADQSGRSGCAVKKNKSGFECPVVGRLEAVKHPRYANPNDCKLFFVCFNGKGPARDSGCDLGLVFDESLAACAAPNQVPACANYYEGYFEEYFANLFGAPADDKHLQVAASFGLHIPEGARKKPVAEQPKKIFNANRRRIPSPASASRIPADETPEEVAPHRFVTPTESKPQSDTPRRRVRPGTRRRRPSTTTTTTTTTTTPATTSAEPEYVYDEYYEGDYYYYDDNSTKPVEGGAVVEEPSTTTTTTTSTTTTTTPPPATEAPTTPTRRGLPSTRRRPVRPLRPSRFQPENVEK